MSSEFRGVFPAMVTPMTKDEEIDLGKLEALVEYLIGAGVHGLIPLGSTGEFYALTPAERRDVLATVIRTAAGRVPVVAGVNAGATREVAQFAREAEALGASGVMVAPPYYSLPREDELLEHVRAVNAAIGIPIFIACCRCSRCWSIADNSRSWSRPAADSPAAMPARRDGPCCRRARRNWNRFARHSAN